MNSGFLSFLEKGTPKCSPKLATPDEAKKIASEISNFFENDYSFPSVQDFERSIIDLFPTKNTNEQVQYVQTDADDANLDSDSSDRKEDNSDSSKEKIWSLLNTAFATNSIYHFQKCLQHNVFSPCKKTSNEIKNTMNSIVKTISSSDNFLGFYPETNYSAKILMKYDKLASPTAFCVSQSQLFIGLIDGNNSSNNGQIDVYNINFIGKRIANQQENQFKSSQILFPPIPKLKHHEHYSIVYVKNIVYQIFDSMIRIKPLDWYDTEAQKYNGIIEFKKHESLRYPAITDGNKIYCFDKGKKVVNIFTCDFDLSFNDNSSYASSEEIKDSKDNLLMPKFERSVSLSFPILIIDTDYTIMSTDGSVITFGYYNPLKKENNDDSSSAAEGNTTKYHFFIFSLMNGKLLKKFNKKYDSIIDAWCFNPFKVTHFVLSHGTLRFLKGVASIPRWIEGYSTPVGDKKTLQQVPEAFEMAVYEGSTFFSVGNDSSYQEAFQKIFELENIHLLKAYANIFISYSTEVDDVIQTLNNEYAKSVKHGVSRLLFFTFLAIMRKARRKFDENNFASHFIEGNNNLDVIFIFPTLFDFEKLPLTNKAINKVFLYSLEKENEFPYESLFITKHYCQKISMNLMNEAGFSIIKESVEKVFYRVSQYIDIINNGNMQVDSFKKTSTFNCWVFFVNEIARHKSIWIYYADCFLNILNFSLSKSVSDLSFQMNLSLILYLEILTSLPHQNQEGYFQNLDEFYTAFENPLNGVDRELDSQLFELLNYAFNLTRKKFADCLFKCRQFIKFDEDSTKKVQDYIQRVGLLDYLIVENTQILLPIKTKKFTNEFIQLFSENSSKLSKGQLIILSFYSSQLGDLVVSISKKNLPLIKDFSLFFDIAKISKQLIKKHKITFSIIELINADGYSLESKYDILVQLKDHISEKYVIFEKMKEESLDENKEINYLKLCQTANQPHHYTLWVLFYLALQTNYLISAKKSSSSPYFHQKNDDSNSKERRNTREKSVHNITTNKKHEYEINIEEYLDIFKAHIICGDPNIIRMVMKCITFANQIINKNNSKMNPIFSFLMLLLKQYISEKINPFLLQSVPATTLESIFIIIQYMKEMFNEVDGQFRSFFLNKVKKINSQEKAIPIFAILNNSIEVIRPNVEIHLLNESLEQIVGIVVSHDQSEARATIRKFINKDQTIDNSMQSSSSTVDIEVNLSKSANIWCVCPKMVKLSDIKDLKPFVHLFFNVQIKTDKNDQSETYFANSFKFASLWEFIDTTSLYDMLNEVQISKIVHKRSFPSSFYPELYLFDFGYYMALRWMKFPPFSFVDVANARNMVSRSPVVNNLVLKPRFKDSGVMTTLFDSSTLVSPPIHPMNKMKIFIYLYPKEKTFMMFSKRKVHDIQLNVFALALPFNCVLQSHDFYFDAFPDKIKEIVVEFCPKIIAFKIYEDGTLIKKTLGSPSIAMYFMTINLESNNVVEYRVEYTTKRTNESHICLSQAFAFGSEEVMPSSDDTNELESESESDSDSESTTEAQIDGDIEIEKDSDETKNKYDEEEEEEIKRSREEEESTEKDTSSKENIELYFDDNTDENYMKMTDEKVFTQMNDSSVFNEISLRDSASGLIDSFRTLITIHHLKKVKTYVPFCVLNLFASIDPYQASKSFSLDEIVPTPHFRDTSEYIYKFIKEYVNIHKKEILANLYKEMKWKYLNDSNGNKSSRSISIEDYDKTLKNLFCITNENRSAMLVRKNQNISISNCIIFSASSKKPLKIIGLFEDDVKLCFSHPGIIVPFLQLSGSIVDYLIHIRHIMTISITLQQYDFKPLKAMIDKLEHSGRYFTPLFHEFVEILDVFNPKVPMPFRFPPSLNPLSFLVGSSLVHENPGLFLLTSYCEYFGNKVDFVLGPDKKTKKIKYVKNDKKCQLYISIHDNDNLNTYHCHRFEFTIKADIPIKIKTNTYTVVDSDILNSLTFECTSEKVEEANLTFVICKIPKIEVITNDLKKWKPHHTHQLLTFLYWKCQDEDKSKKKKKKKNKDKSKQKVKRKSKKNKDYTLLQIDQKKLADIFVNENYKQIPLSTEFSFKTAKFIIAIISQISNIIQLNETSSKNADNSSNKNESDSDIFNASDNSSENESNSNDYNNKNSQEKRKSVFVLNENDSDDPSKESNNNNNNINSSSNNVIINNNYDNVNLFFYYFHMIEIKKNHEKVEPILAPFEYFRRIADRTFMGKERVTFLKQNELTFSTQLDPDAIRINLEFPLYRQYETEFHSRLRQNTLIKYIHDDNFTDNEKQIKRLLKFLKKSPSIVLLMFVDFVTGLWGTGWLLGKSETRDSKNPNHNRLVMHDMGIIYNYINHSNNNYEKDEGEFDTSKTSIYVYLSKEPEFIESYQPGNLLILGNFESSEKLSECLMKKLQEYQDTQMNC